MKRDIFIYYLLIYSFQKFTYFPNSIILKVIYFDYCALLNKEFCCFMDLSFIINNNDRLFANCKQNGRQKCYFLVRKGQCLPLGFSCLIRS